MNTHTQGNWNIEENVNHFPFIMDDDGNLISLLIDTKDGSLFYGRTLEETKANAKLIAAAPELLEALQKTLENITARISYFKEKEGENSFNAGVFQAIVNIHEEAIKKATN